MPQLSLFDNTPELPAQAQRLGPRLRALAGQGVYLGTSSWRYEGWQGSIYAPETYQVRGRFSRKRFEESCLAQYAATFPIAGGDFSFYQFPTRDFWTRLFNEGPAPLLFALKVPEQVTVDQWPTHARYGARAGRENPEFLDADLLTRAFLQPLEPFRDRVAVVMFQFGTFTRKSFAGPQQFLDRLAPFLARLPSGFRYSVEIRNPGFLKPPYFSVLANHNVAHLFNAWTRMPDLADQFALTGSITADFVVARALLARGQTYQQAVQRFEPYDRLQEPQPPTRDGLVQLARAAIRQHKPAFLLVNNRLEGHAPTTIEAVANQLAV